MSARTILVLVLLSSAVRAQEATRSFEHGYYLEHALRDFEAAAESYRAAIADPDAEEDLVRRARVRLAVCLVELGRGDEARQVFDSAAAGPAEIPAPRVLWRREIMGPIGPIVANEQSLAFADAAGDLHVLSVATGEPAIREPIRGMSPLAWAQTHLLLASSDRVAILDLWGAQVEKEWAAAFGPEGPAGGWFVKGGAVVVGRNGFVFGADAEPSDPVEWIDRLPDGSIVSLERSNGIARNLLRTSRWTLTAGGIGFRRVTLAGSTIVTAELDEVSGHSMSEGSRRWRRAFRNVAALAGAPEGDRVLVFGPDGRVAAFLAASGRVLAEFDLGLAGIDGATWSRGALLVATRTELVAIEVPRLARIHRVAAGDSLYSIARRYYGDGARWRSVLDANGLYDSHELRVGQELLIPEGVAESPEEDLASLLAARESLARRVEEGISTASELELMDLDVARLRFRSGELDEAAYRAIVERTVTSQLARLDALRESGFLTSQEYLERRRWLEGLKR